MKPSRRIRWSSSTARNPEHQADGDERAAEEQQVLARHPPAVVVPQALVLAQPGPLVAGHEARVGEGQQQRPADVAIHAEQHHDYAWRQHQLRQPALQAIERRDATRRYRSRGIDRELVAMRFSREPTPHGGTEPVGRIERSPGRAPRQGLLRRLDGGRQLLGGLLRVRGGSLKKLVTTSKIAPARSWKRPCCGPCSAPGCRPGKPA